MNAAPPLAALPTWLADRAVPAAFAALALLALTAGHPGADAGQAAPMVPITPVNVERNVIYGMYSGSALLMDVHRPVKSNGYGILFVAGSGWHAPLEYSAK